MFRELFQTARARRRVTTCAGALAIGLTATLIACGGGGDDDDTIPEPETLTSRDGVLNVTLRQAPSSVVVAGRRFTSNVFNDSYIPPVLKLQRGDRMALTLQNRIGAADTQIAAPMETNLHYHGMSVTPIAPGDDVFLHVGSGADYLYEWDVPASHPQGPHWYHPHAHGLVESQILSGMSGMLIIDGLLDHFPAFKGLTERHYIMKDIVLPGADPDSPKTKTINGLLGGKIRLRPGEMQVWNLGNLGADAYFDLAIEGLQFWEINRDGNILLSPRRIASVFLPPGSRSTVIAVAPAASGRYAVRTQMVDTGPQGDENDDVQLATLIVDGTPADTAALQARLADAAIGIDTPTTAQVGAYTVTRQRTITFSETADGNTFFIDGREYDANRDDVTVHLGDVEEWTLVNTSGERHVFHIHQMDFLVKSINNQDIDETGLRDVIDIPYAQNGVPGQVKLIVPFIDPVMVGRFVFHCHIVEHEDDGMMANVVVLPPGATAMPAARMRTVSAASPVDTIGASLRRWLAANGMGSMVPTPGEIDPTVCRTPTSP